MSMKTFMCLKNNNSVFLLMPSDLSVAEDGVHRHCVDQTFTNGLFYGENG